MWKGKFSPRPMEKRGRKDVDSVAPRKDKGPIRLGGKGDRLPRKSPARTSKGTGSRKIAIGLTSGRAVRKRMDATVIASGVASGGNGLDGNGERDVRDTDHKAAGSSALSIADRVVTEYEKLLEALPTMARHMGKLQGDTEVMAEDLEKRVRSLVDGYRELNDLVDNAPTRVMDAASQYAQALGVVPVNTSSTSALGDEDIGGQALDIEGIYQELFALREAKLALDDAVALVPDTASNPGRSVRDRGAFRQQIDENRGAATNQVFRSRVSLASVGRVRERSSKSDVSPTSRMAARSAATVVADKSGRGSSGRRALSEMPVDPCMPLPLPAFPGYNKLFRISDRDGSGRFQAANASGLYVDSAGSRKDNFTHNAVMGGAAQDGDGRAAASTSSNHGYFVPGVITPKQKQSHGLPQELRAISTIPKPERLLPASSGRRRVRARSKLSTAAERAESRIIPPPPPQPRLTAIPAKPDDAISAARSPVIDVAVPGSVAAMAAAREQRKYTTQAVNELRKEMREREARLEKELDRLRTVRAPRGADAVPSPAIVPAIATVPREKSPSGRDVASQAKVARNTRRMPTYGSVAGRYAGRSSVRGARTPGSAQRKPRSVPGDRKVIRSKSTSGRSGDDSSNKPSRALAGKVEKPDAHAQTASDEVQNFPTAQPTVAGILRSDTERRYKRTESTATNTGTGVCFVGESQGDVFVDPDISSVPRDGPELGESAEGHDDPGGPGVFPPPPVVFLEGEGRNVSWRPSDDDRLLGVAGKGGGGGGGGRDGVFGSGEGGTKEGIDSGDRRQCVIIAGEDETNGGDGGDVSPSKAITISKAAAPDELFHESAVSELVDRFLRDKERCAGLAGMMTVSATVNSAAPIPTHITAGKEEVRIRDEEEIEPSADEALSSTVAPTALPTGFSNELVGLMREVVEQQRGLGEERSALMEALRAEVDSRRADLANQEHVLQARESALESREADTVRRKLAMMDAGLRQHGQQDGREDDRPSIAGLFYPTEGVTNGVEREGRGSDSNEKADLDAVAMRDQSHAEAKEKGGESTEQPLHAFRSNLGRMLAGGKEWTQIPLDEVRETGRRYSTSLGRALAGGPAWRQLPLAEDRRAGDLSPEQPARTVGQAQPQNADALPASEADVEELLWEAGTEREKVIQSPDTAVRERASALESRRFLKAMAEVEAEAEAERRVSNEGGDESPLDRGESQVAVTATEAYAQTEEKEEGTRRAQPLGGNDTNFSTQQEGSGRLHLTLATAILSVAQRISIMDDRTSARVEGAEGLARRALEEAREEGHQGRQRQSEMILRLKDMEHGSEERNRIVTREIAKLREEGRLARARSQPPPLPLLPPPQASLSIPRAEGAIILTTGSSPSSNSNSISDASIESARVLDNSRPNRLRQSAPGVRSDNNNHQPTTPRSESRSSMSEGQLRGSFSDGELVRLSPRGRHALEDGELPPPPPPPPAKKRPPDEQKSSSCEADAESSPGNSSESASRPWVGRGDPREYLTLLMSAHPRLKGNRSFPKNTGKGDDGVSARAKRRVPRQSSAQSQPTAASSSKISPTRGAGLGATWSDEEKGSSDDRDSVFEPNRSGPGTSDGEGSREPGEASPNRIHRYRRGQMCVDYRGSGVLDGGDEFCMDRNQRYGHEEHDGGSSGEASSGADVGEIDASKMFGAYGVGGADEQGKGDGKGRRSQPLVPLRVEKRSLERERWRQIEVDRAVAEDELDRVTDNCQANATDLASLLGAPSRPIGTQPPLSGDATDLGGESRGFEMTWKAESELSGLEPGEVG